MFETIDIDFENLKKSTKKEIQSIVDVIIVGSGPAGLTAGVYSVMNGYQTIVLEGPEPGGQLTTTTKVYNFPGYPDGIDGTKLMVNMRDQVVNLGARIYSETVISLKKENEIFYIYTNNFIYKSRSVIVAVGSKPKKLKTLKNWDLFWNHGVSVCAICDGHLFKGKRVVVIGGGNTALSDSIYLSRLADKVFIIVRKDYLRAIDMLKKSVEKLSNIEILYNCEAIEVNGGESSVSLLRILNNRDNTIFELSVSAVFIAIGYKPNTEFLQGFLDLDDEGYILTKDTVKTSVEGVFSCGDVSNKIYAQAITAAAEGFIASASVRAYLEYY